MEKQFNQETPKELEVIFSKDLKSNCKHTTVRQYAKPKEFSENNLARKDLLLDGPDYGKEIVC